MEQPGVSAEKLVFNGVNGANGDYLLPPVSPQLIAAVARDEPIDLEHLRQLQARSRRESEPTFAPMEGVDPQQLAESGWGVVFAVGAEPAVREALSELLDHRRQEATAIKEQRYREFTNEHAVRPGEAAHQWLARHGAGGASAVNPDKMPYYLLLVGTPEEIPYKFQYQLDVQHAVGRIHFETLDEYAQYARSVVLAETGGVALPRRARFFGVRNPDDRSTALSESELVRPLAAKLAQSNWDVQAVLNTDATKGRLQQLLGGAETPALLFTASHGMGFPNGDSRQLPHQGALLCSDWPGPQQHRGAIPQDFYLAGDDVGDDARLLGLIAFHFACYGGGTPRWDDFAHRGLEERAAIAPHAFVARLPQRLLGHPKGGALAVIAHVERAWGYSFMWWQSAKATQQLEDFESTLMRLFKGQRVGWALEYFNTRYANLSSILTSELEEIKFGKVVDEIELAGMWTANNDARGYAIIGDPAVRLPLANTPDGSTERPVIAAVVSRTPSAVTATPSQPAPAQPPEPTTPDTDSATLTGAQTMLDTAPSTLTAPRNSGTPDTAFGLTDTLRDAQARLSDALQRFMAKLGTALEDAATLEVTTYVIDAAVGVPADDSAQSAGAQLRALTRIELTGDIKTYIPQNNGAVDETLWMIHSDMVVKAQANRTELVKTAVSAVSGLVGMIKP